MELIKDKVAIVTGAAAGIGAGVAKLFAQGGAHVFLTDIDGLGVKKVAATLQTEGGSAFGFEANAEQSRRNGDGSRECAHTLWTHRRTDQQRRCLSPAALPGNDRRAVGQPCRTST